MKKKWRVYPEIGKAFINQFPQYNPLILQLLVNRGFQTQEEIDEFFNSSYHENIHDPFLFNDMEKVVKRIFLAIEKKEKIVVFGDFDADGVTSSAVMATVLKALNADVEVYIPHREMEGYGLSMDSVKKLKEDGFSLIITVDCGISNYEEVELINELGMDVIITDHHYEPLQIPNALAILNPHLERENYPFESLAGVGVAYKVAQALLRTAQKQAIPLNEDYQNQYGNYEAFEKWLLDIVAIGTVADCVPLLGENRTLVKYGLLVLKQTKRIGLKLLMEAINVNLANLTTVSIGYQIAPRINAAGRLAHAKTAYNLLMENEKDKAWKLVEELNQINTERQKLTEEIFKEAKEQVEKQKDDSVMVAVGEKWPIGVLGLVAGKLAEAYNAPTLVISNAKGVYQGSGRSIEGFNIVEALQSIDSYFAHYGGHAQACGFTLEDNSVLEAFQGDIKSIAQNILAKADLNPVLNIDAKISLQQLNWDLYEALEKFKPYGEANPQPLFLAENVKIIQYQLVGKNNKHLRLLLKQEGSPIFWKTIAFGLGEVWGDILQQGDYIDIVFTVALNEWNGNRELQLQIQDIKLKDNIG